MSGVAGEERRSEGRVDGAPGEFNAVEFLNNEGWQRVELGLDRTRELLSRLGDPQQSCAYVHVAGTNGKGSVCAFIESALRHAGLAPGLFTSPAIYSFEERICVDGVPINADELLAATLAVKRATDAMVAEGWEHPTGFELMFATAAVHFKAVGCRIAVLEVGLGGRLDATNVIEAPEVCVITPIGLDHTDVLGETLGAIAGEKAAIIKAGAEVVSGFQAPEAWEVIEAAARAADDALSRVDETALSVESLDLAAGKRRFAYRGDAFETRLLGSYQPENAALAIEACRALIRRGWTLSEGDIVAGVAEARWPGRFEIVGTAPLVIVDGAHNPAGAESLRASLDDLLASLTDAGQRPRVVLVCGVLADKDAEGILGALAGVADALFTFAPPSYRALPAEELVACARRVWSQKASGPKAAGASGPLIEACDTAERALDRAFFTAGADGIVVCAGSLYSLGEIRDALGVRAREAEQPPAAE